MENQIFIPTERQFREIIAETVDSILARRIPVIIRQANTKAFLTTTDVKKLTGLSSRMQKYHRDTGNLPYSQDGRKIIYRTADVEQFLDDRRISYKKESRLDPV